jgi:hypothetical protein
MFANNNQQQSDDAMMNGKRPSGDLEFEISCNQENYEEMKKKLNILSNFDDTFSLKRWFSWKTKATR